MKVRALAIVLFALTAAGCGPAIDDSDDLFLRETYAHIRDGQVEAVEASLDPSIRTAGTSGALDQLRALIGSAGAPCERSMIGATTFRLFATSGTVRRLTAQHQYVCPHATLIVSARLRAEGDGRRIIEHFVVTPIDPRAAANAATFELQGQSSRQYAFLAAALASPALMLIALLGVLLTKGFKSKWLWAIISLVGIAKFTMVWGTGEILSSPFTINLLGFGIVRGASPLAPWMVSFTPPLGALIALSLLWPRWAGLGRANDDT